MTGTGLPFTTRPSLTSKHGITLFNQDNPPRIHPDIAAFPTIAA